MSRLGVLPSNTTNNCNPPRNRMFSPLTVPILYKQEPVINKAIDI